MANVKIRKVGNMVFADHFNSSEIFLVKGFDTERKARNYAKRNGYKVVDEIPETVSEFQYWD